MLLSAFAAFSAYAHDDHMSLLQMQAKPHQEPKPDWKQTALKGATKQTEALTGEGMRFSTRRRDQNRIVDDFTRLLGSRLGNGVTFATDADGYVTNLTIFKSVTGTANGFATTYCVEENCGLPPPTTAAPETTANVGAIDDPHLTDVSGDKFDLYNDGRHTLLVIPDGATKETADLHIRGTVKRYGNRKNDLWIRNLAIAGKWVPGGSYMFKTNDGKFNDPSTQLVRRLKTDAWTNLDAITDASLMTTSSDHAEAPSSDFEEQVTRSVVLQAGPVQVLVDYGTVQKDGADVNHLDLHVQGLASIENAGGLLAGEIAS